MLTGAAQAPAANEPTWAVDVPAGSRCADDALLMERLTAQIPENQRAPLARAELRAEVVIGKDQASVRVVDQLGQREAGQRQIALPKGGCAAAADPLSLVLAVMIEAGRAQLAPAPVAEPEPPPEPPTPPPEEQPTPEPPPPPRARKRERHAWLGPPPGHDLYIAAGTGYGLLPPWGLGGTAAWGIRWQRVWPIWVSGTGWFRANTDDGRAALGAAYGTLSTCPLVLEKARFRGELCPGLAVGAMWAEGRKVTETQRTTNPLAMASLALHARVKLVGPLELVGVVRGEAPVMHLTFVYYREDGQAPAIHETKPVTVSLFGGLGLRFR